MEERKINKKTIFSIVAVLVLVIVIAGATYAYFTAAKSTDVQTVQTGTLALDFENGDIVRGDDLMPISDQEINTKAAELAFTVTNVGDQHMNITVNLTDIQITDPLKHINYRWGLFNADTGVAVARGVFEDIGTNKEMLLIKDVVLDAPNPEAESNPYSTKNYILRIWIHDNGAPQDEMQGQTFSAKVTVDGEAVKYTDESCFTFDESTGTIIGYSDTCPKDIIIPRTINGVAVTAIGDSSANYWDTMEHLTDKKITSGITSVVFPDSVNKIYGYSFSENALTYVRIPEKTTISDGAFYSNSIESIALADDSNMGIYTFSNNNLQHVTIVYDIELESFNNNPLTSIVIMHGVSNLFSSDGSGYYDQITSLEIPSSVSGVDGYWPSLTELVVRGPQGNCSISSLSGTDVVAICRP